MYELGLTKKINQESEDLQLIWLENNNKIDGVTDSQLKKIISKIKEKRDFLSKANIGYEISFEDTPENIYKILHRFAIIGKVESVRCSSPLTDVSVSIFSKVGIGTSVKFCRVIFYPNSTLIEVMNGDVDKIINYINNDLIEAGLPMVLIKVLN